MLFTPKIEVIVLEYAHTQSPKVVQYLYISTWQFGNVHTGGAHFQHLNTYENGPVINL